MPSFYCQVKFSEGGALGELISIPKILAMALLTTHCKTLVSHHPAR